jgi:protein phosphatase PTC7
VENTGTVALGVVDGVGGWTDSGIDPADFSHSLCEHMGRLAASYPTGIEDAAIPLRPVKLLDFGYNCVMRDRDVLAGSSTACIATASRGGMLEVAK